jgi:hypothetical protein
VGRLTLFEAGNWNLIWQVVGRLTLFEAGNGMSHSL